MTRAAIAWVLYYLGTIAYKLDCGRSYQRLMEWSAAVQGNNLMGPWEPKDDEPL